MDEDEAARRIREDALRAQLNEGLGSLSEKVIQLVAGTTGTAVWFTVEHDGERTEVPWSALDQVNQQLLEMHGRYLLAEDVEQLIRDQIAEGHWPMPGVG